MTRLKPHITNALIITLLLVFSSNVHGNKSVIHKIKGMVLDQETGKTVPLAEVFISNTTYGSITDERGEFGLNTSYLPCKIVVSHISYATFTTMIDGNSKPYLSIELIPHEHEIKEISVVVMNNYLILLK